MLYIWICSLGPATLYGVCIYIYLLKMCLYYTYRVYIIYIIECIVYTIYIVSV